MKLSSLIESGAAWSCRRQLQARVVVKTQMNVLLGLLILGGMSLAPPRADGYYDPGVQRWINRDPVAEAGFRATSHSERACTSDTEGAYEFCANSPVGRWDYLGLDNPGCDLPTWVLQSPGYQQHKDCFLRCCAKHDECYYNTDCSWTSWFVNLVQVVSGRCGPYGLILSIGLEFHPCVRCNQQVALCFAKCVAGIDPGGSRWFCPNGPSPPKGNFYDNWDDIPAVCWENGIKPGQPP